MRPRKRVLVCARAPLAAELAYVLGLQPEFAASSATTASALRREAALLAGDAPFALVVDRDSYLDGYAEELFPRTPVVSFGIQPLGEYGRGGTAPVSVHIVVRDGEFMRALLAGVRTACARRTGPKPASSLVVRHLPAQAGVPAIRQLAQAEAPRQVAA